MEDTYILISTTLKELVCARCGESSQLVAYSVNGYATTAQIGDGMLSADLRRLCIQLRLSLCKPCLAQILSEKDLTLRG